MFNTIQKGITMKPPASKEEDENPESIYFDRGLLPIIVPPRGGRKTRRKKTSSKKTRKGKRKSNKRRTFKGRKY